MPVEGPITDISDLNEAWPLDADLQQQTDEHLRLTKDAIKKTFPDLAANGGVINATATEIDAMLGVRENVQQQIDEAEPLWRTVTAATDSPLPNERLACVPPIGGLVITLPEAPPNGVEIIVFDALGSAQPPDSTIQCVRSGSDTITTIDSNVTDRNQFTVGFDNQAFTLTYFDGVWYMWSSAIPM